MATERVADFTSSLYLCFRHASGELGAWPQLSLGRPAAVRRWPEAAKLEGELARLCGTPATAVGRSTLHLFWDLMGTLGPFEWTVCLDEHCYPIARWASIRHRHVGGQVVGFPHHDQERLLRLVESISRDGKRPVVITDSYCCTCGRYPDLRAYAEPVARTGGLVVIDDTQTLGLWGESPNARNHWGSGGGGCLRYHGLADAPVVTISSVAKAFGVPLAIATGSTRAMAGLRNDGDTMIHCSQPSIADIRALESALRLNRQCGEARRQALRDRIVWFQNIARSLNLNPVAGDHPTQALRVPRTVPVMDIVTAIRGQGYVCLPGRDHDDEPRLVFLLNSSHTRAEVTGALESAGTALNRFLYMHTSRWRARRAMRGGIAPGDVHQNSSAGDY